MTLSDPEVELVMVHGTFARKAGWTREDSLISQALLAKIPNAKLSSLVWSGRNSHAARIEAGRALAAYLAERKAAAPNRARFVIAHSHGGNVALYALAQDSGSIQGIVFLGTPFLAAKARDLKPFIATLAFQSSWLVPGLILTALAFVTWGAKAAVFSAAVGTWFGIAAAARFTHRLSEPLGRVMLRSLSARQTAVLERLQPRALQCPSLVCRTLGDEARGWLRSLGSVSGAFPLFTRYAVQLVNTWPFIVVLLMLSVVVDWLIGERGAFAVSGALGSFALLLVGLPLILLLGLVVPLASVVLRGHAAGFGWEGLLGYSVVDISASDLPVTATSVVPTVVELPDVQGSGFLRHSRLYEDAVVLAKVSEWIQHRVADGPHHRDDRTHEATAVHPKPSDHPQISAKLDADALLHCLAVQLGLFAIGVVWAATNLFYPFDSVSEELKRGPIVTHQLVVSDEPHRLGPGENAYISFLLNRPENVGRCYLRGAFQSDSAEARLAVGLERGAPQWEDSSMCGYAGKFAHTIGFGRRHDAFSAPVHFGASTTARGCIAISNYGKKSSASVTAPLFFECLAADSISISM